jgi:hypothetical protein
VAPQAVGSGPAHAGWHVGAAIARPNKRVQTDKPYVTPVAPRFRCARTSRERVVRPQSKGQAVVVLVRAATVVPFPLRGTGFAADAHHRSAGRAPTPRRLAGRPALVGSPGRGPCRSGLETPGRSVCAAYPHGCLGRSCSGFDDGRPRDTSALPVRPPGSLEFHHADRHRGSESRCLVDGR